MTSTELMQSMLDEWSFKYIVGTKFTDREVTFIDFTELAMTDGFRMGYIRCYWNNTFIRGEVWLDDDHTKCPTFFRDAVLWHEFCHYWDACEMKHVDHCWDFQKKKLRKPLYALGDVVLKLIGWWWFD